jgi:hypothetical protein
MNDALQHLVRLRGRPEAPVPGSVVAAATKALLVLLAAVGAVLLGWVIATRTSAMESLARRRRARGRPHPCWWMSLDSGAMTEPPTSLRALCEEFVADAVANARIDAEVAQPSALARRATWAAVRKMIEGSSNSRERLALYAPDAPIPATPPDSLKRDARLLEQSGVGRVIAAAAIGDRVDLPAIAADLARFVWEPVSSPQSWILLDMTLPVGTTIKFGAYTLDSTFALFGGGSV